MTQRKGRKTADEIVDEYKSQMKFKMTEWWNEQRWTH